VGVSLGFWTGDAVVDIVCGGCCFAAASAPELEKGHQLMVRCVCVCVCMCVCVYVCVRIRLDVV
jgi:hypothetical protein